MKTLGIIGGIAPGSTVDYYRLLITEYREHKRDGTYPSILINSIDLKRLLDLVDANRLDELADWLVREVERRRARNCRCCCEPATRVGCPSWTRHGFM